jgi:UDP-N-acetylglucosamine--N-acetylmuramyl-(pentapeptide) pyrophosphoryl-undecaprenol N-acetylglucosamine transferase
VSTIVIAGGGTGGHVFPGLAVVDELRRIGATVSWVGAARGLEAALVPEAGISIRLLHVTGLAARSRGAQLGALVRLVVAFGCSCAHLQRVQAAAVLSVGGYACVPAALAAGALGIPLVVQEQNARPGLANRLLAPWAVAITCGFAETAHAFPSLPALLTGNPVRPEFFAVPEPPRDELAVLVLGGSQGSAFLNQALPDAFARLAAHGHAPRILHQAGARAQVEVRARYAALGVPAEVVGFLARPAEALARVTLVVARAGALTVSELAAARRAALLIPFAAAAHGHQADNAQALAATGAAEVLAEERATPERLALALARLVADPAQLVQRGRAGAALARSDAARAVAHAVVQASGQAIAAPAAARGGG